MVDSGLNSKKACQDRIICTAPRITILYKNRDLNLNPKSYSINVVNYEFLLHCLKYIKYVCQKGDDEEDAYYEIREDDNSFQTPKLRAKRDEERDDANTYSLIDDSGFGGKEMTSSSNIYHLADGRYF